MKMNKLIFAGLIVGLATGIGCAQEKTQKGEPEEQPGLSKLESFISKRGTVIKFEDFNLSPLKLIYSGAAEAKIRKITSGTESQYFYQIEKRGQYSSYVASIAYEDVLELIRALGTLESELDKDIALNPDYLENKFVTDDGFQMGYYVNAGKSNWYLKLESHGDNTIFIKDSDSIRQAFDSAKTTIERLRQ
jgi:hypothetical protein